MSRPNNFKGMRWTPEELERLKNLITEYKGEPELIMPHFPNRTLAALKEAAKRYGIGIIKHADLQKYYRGAKLNPNPITYTTRLLVKNYYADDMRKGYSHDMAIRDICGTLNRDTETVERILQEGL